MKMKLVVLIGLLIVSTIRAEGDLPYRFLLVVSDQWKDPSSTIIEGGDEFNVIAALLKSWNLPFEILRLDQQRIDRYHMVERDGRPRYGTIIWDAGGDQLGEKGLPLIGELVKTAGVNLVVMGDAVMSPELGDLAGVRYESEFVSADPLTAALGHFVTRGLLKGERLPARGNWPGIKARAVAASTLLSRGPHPYLTAREWPGGGRVAWLAAHRPSNQIRHQLVRDLLKRCLVWAQGYALYAEYGKAVILMMDDMGTAEKTFLSYWSYKTPSEEEIRKGLIEPLKKRGAVLMQNVNTGFIDRRSQRVLNPWKQERVDDQLVPGRVHDFASTKRGLDAGLREGVFEIQSQGWTHMLPDLDSPPGPWWTAPMDGTGSLGWWTEFGDPVRKKEIPAATQRFHMLRSLEQIREDFGVTPLFLMRGGGGRSTSFPNHSARLAAQLGFGLSELDGDEYLSRDLVIDLKPILPRASWAYDETFNRAAVKWTPDAPLYIVFHDRDLAMDNASIARLLDALGDVRYMSANEYSAYLHAGVEVETGASGLPAFKLHYDDHYCRRFADAPSQWTLHLSDAVRARAAVADEKQQILVPKGTGAHSVEIRSGGITVR